MARWLKMGLLFAVALAGTQLLLPPSAAKRLGGGLAPPLALNDLAGRTIDLQALRGRVVLVNFWATWCPPCRAEIPDLSQLRREQREGCFEILGVAEDSPKAELLAWSRSMPYPVLTDPRGAAAADWSVVGFPSSYLVDPEGRVVRVFEGAVTRRQVLEAMRPHQPESCRGT